MWKTKLGQCIYTSPSGFKVYQNYWYRWLTLGSDTLQTVLNRRKPYKPVLDYVLPLTMLARSYPGQSCLLGLGGGAIPHLLYRDILNDPLTVVDYSKEIIQISCDYFYMNQLHPIHIIHQNAADFVRYTEDKFEHLIVDIYGDQHFPAECFNSDFFFNCKNKLSENGFLSINLANRNEQQPILQFIRQHFQFNTLLIPIKKSANVVIIASVNENTNNFLDKIRATKTLKRLFWIGDWGNIGEY